MSETNENKKSFLTKIKALTEQRWFVHTLPIVFLVALVILFSALTKGRFSSPAMLKLIFQQAVIVATAATGASFIYASGNINLAMGATTVLTATLAAIIYNSTHNFWLMFISAVLIAVGLMVISVLLSTVFNVRVMFVTIVMMTLFKAIQDSVLKGSTLGVPYDLVVNLSNYKYSVIAFACFFVFAIVLFHFTAVGRSLKTIGTNNENAFQTGIEKSKYLMIAFIVAGLGAGLASIMVIERAGSLSNNTLASLNNDVLLAVVLGGMSIFGGSKSFAYTGIVGALTVCVLNQGLIMVGVDSTIIQAVRGIIFLVLIMTAQQRPKGLPAPEG
ncbi:MAG: ABC transporter permease [Firmicutes bacterium]|nr:ABC transporter permease [Bacillota bacterium]